MLQATIDLLVIALFAALLGFGGLAGSFAGLAKIAFFVSLVLAVLLFVAGGVFRGGVSGSRRNGLCKGKKL
jgi:uncharacterized membrane protein YtjA (UPF0391 family)